jgi:hypothetical protein
MSIPQIRALCGAIIVILMIGLSSPVYCGQADTRRADTRQAEVDYVVSMNREVGRIANLIDTIFFDAENGRDYNTMMGMVMMSRSSAKRIRAARPPAPLKKVHGSLLNFVSYLDLTLDNLKSARDAPKGEKRDYYIDAAHISMGNALTGLSDWKSRTEYIVR